MRYFIAFFIPEKIKKTVLKIQEEIKKLPLVAKFVEIENIHITLSFLGERSEKEIEEIKENLEDVCKKFKSFNTKLQKIELIPNEKFIRVIALSLNSNFNTLIERIKEKIKGDSKPPHLTLCRVKSILRKEEFKTKLSKIDFMKEEFEVKEIHLTQSILTPKGPIYKIVQKFKLS